MGKNEDGDESNEVGDGSSGNDSEHYVLCT